MRFIFYETMIRTSKMIATKQYILHYSLLLITILTASFTASAQYSVSGGNLSPYKYNISASGGLEGIYFINGLSGSYIEYTSTSTSLKMYKYTHSLADKTEIPATKSTLGSTTTYRIDNLEDGRGYQAGDDSPIWIVDYAQHQPQLNSLRPAELLDSCQSLQVRVDKLDEIIYYTVHGTPTEIPRLYSVSYETLEWNEASAQFMNKTYTSNKPFRIGTEFSIDAPLKDTEITLTEDDDIAQHFGKAKQIHSEPFTAQTVQAHIIAERINNSESSNSEASNTELGGSAPAEVNFSGYANDNVAAHYTWFIYRNNDYENPVIRYYNETDISYTFTLAGKYDIVLEVANENSECITTVSEQLSISESELDIPNFFSPGDSPGVNDEFKVKHKSLIRFKCSIFNRWGNKLFEFTDPDKGWDGKYKGTYVSPGVYFYVIEAEGSDGIKYKKGGDINILRSK